GTRVYWLTWGDQPGLRISNFNELPGGGYQQQFSGTVELRQRTTYFAALINSTDENFFGALVSSTPIDQVLDASHVSAAGATPRLEVVLQGVGEGVPHDVAVALNGGNVGQITFTGQNKGRLRADLPPDLVLEGANTVTLTAQDGDSDVSLVDHIDITYSHS